HSQRCCNERVVWLILPERLKRVARLFSGSFCRRNVASYALDQRQPHLLDALVNAKSKLQSSLSSLHQLGGLSGISFKSQLGQFNSNGHVRIRLCLYLNKRLSGFLQVTFVL